MDALKVINSLFFALQSLGKLSECSQRQLERDELTDPAEQVNLYRDLNEVQVLR